MLFQFWRKVAKSYGVPFHLLPAAAREERGEKGGRFHFHSLLGGLHHVAGRGVIPSPNPISDNFRIDKIWSKGCGKSGGMADCRAYDARLSGAEYIMKGLDGFDYSNLQANAYEAGKFNEDEEGRELILTPAMWRYIALRSRNRRHLKAQELKISSCDRSSRGVRSSVPLPTRFPHFADPTTRR